MPLELIKMGRGVMEIHPHLPSREDLLPQQQKALTHSPALPQATVPTPEEMCLIVPSLIWPEGLVVLVEASRSTLSLYRVLCLCLHKHKLGRAQSTPVRCRNSLRICLWPTYCKDWSQAAPTKMRLGLCCLLKHKPCLLSSAEHGEMAPRSSGALC